MGMIFLSCAEKNYDNDPRGPWKATPIQARNFYSKGLYEVKSPSGRVIDGPPKGSYWRISEESFKALEKDNRIWWGKKGDNVPAQKRFLSEIEGGVVPSTIWFYDEAGHNAESKNEVRAVFEGLEDELFITPKPERLIQRILHLATKEGDLVLDSFLGSGTSAAVALKMNRKFIGVELGEHAENQCVYRLKKVVDGEQGGISEDVNWAGGSGFKFYRLGDVIFNENGSLKEGISFDALAAHIWYGDTRQSLQQSTKSPLLGVHNGVAYYLLYNGILGDRRPNGGNVLTSKVLAILPPHPEDPKNGKKVIYGETSRMGDARLKSENIIFKQIPYCNYPLK